MLNLKKRMLRYYNPEWIDLKYHAKRLDQTINSTVSLIKYEDEQYIVKQFNHHGDDNNIYRNVSECMMEYELINKLDHPNILKCYDYGWDDRFSYLLLEYAPHSDLFNYQLHYDGRLIPKDKCVKFIKQIIEGLKHVHSMGIIHRDLKLENIFVWSDDICKIGDFGLSIESDDSQEIVGTIEYMSPEMIVGDRYDHRTDIWSLGVLIYDLMIGHTMFFGMEEEEICDQISNLTYQLSCDCSPLLVMLIKSIMSKCEHRISLNEVLNHKWMK